MENSYILCIIKIAGGKMSEELDLETLDSVVAGVSHEIGENATLSKENLYRRQQIKK